MATLNDIFASKSKNTIPPSLQKKIDVALADLNHATTDEHLQEIAVVLTTKYGIKKTAQLVKIIHGVTLKGKKGISKKAKTLLKKETAEGVKKEEVVTVKAVRNERLHGGQALRQQTNMYNTMFDNRVPQDSPLVLHERAQGAINAMEYASRDDLPTILKELTPFYGEEEARSIIYEMTGVHMGTEEEDSAKEVKKKKDKPAWVDGEVAQLAPIDVPSVATAEALTGLAQQKDEKIKQVVEQIRPLKESVGALVEALTQAGVNDDHTILIN